MILIIIRIPEWGSATILEIAWTAIGAMTLAIVAWNYAGAKANLRTPIDLNDEYEVEAASVIRRGYIRREAVRFFIAVVILSIGITGDYQPSLRRPSVTNLTGLVLTAGLFAIGLVTSVQSFFDGHDRKEVRDLLSKSRRFRADTDFESTRRDSGFDDTLAKT